MVKKINSVFNFDNTYILLPEQLFAECLPTVVSAPQLLFFNEDLAKEIGANFASLSDAEKAAYLSGNTMLDGAQAIAQAYAGHQFGYFNRLGDGRAILLGEHLTDAGFRYDIQLKGSGVTPYSRNGDGRATVSAMLREYIVSEAMHALGIATTRSLAVVASGEEVQRSYEHEGAVLTRVAASHIRVGTFEYVRKFSDHQTLQIFTNYTIQRHYPHLSVAENPALSLLTEVMEKQIDLIVQWMRVGFIHGVMNTDNMSIAGETIDYGPCAFMNAYDPQTVFSSIDPNRRYAFGNQAAIAQWNLTRFAECLLPLIASESEQAIVLATEVLNTFSPLFESKWLRMMRNKVGFTIEQDEDEALIRDLLQWMQSHAADYTNTFLALQEADILQEEIYKNDVFIAWYARWQKRRSIENVEGSFALMRQSNPTVIPRNHLVEAALFDASEENNLKTTEDLLAVLSMPYQYNGEQKKYHSPPADGGQGYKTYCGT